jgi:hypothetical protein
MIINQNNASKFDGKTIVTVVLRAGNDFNNRMTDVTLDKAIAAMPELVKEVKTWTKSVVDFKADAYGASAKFTTWSGDTETVRMYIYKD